MAGSIKYQNCDPCLVRHLTKLSAVFCPTCEEALCRDCKEHHKASKLLRDHQLTPIDDYCQLPALLQNIRQFCKVHDELLEFFCQTHDVICCKKCATTSHARCVDVKILTDLLGGSETFPELDELEKSLCDIQGNIKAVIVDRENNLQSLSAEKKTILNDIPESRQKLNNHLDKLENALKQKLEENEKSASSEITQVVKNLKKKDDQLVIIQESLRKVKDIGSNTQKFICTRELRQSIDKLETEIRDTYDSNGCQKKYFSYVPGDCMKDALSTFTALGDIDIKVEMTPRFKLKKTTVNAQISDRRRLNVNHLKISLHETIGMKNMLTGCTILKDGSLIFASLGYDYSSPFILPEIIKRRHKSETRMVVRGELIFDVFPIDDNMIAITTGDRKKFLFHDEGNLSRIKTIDITDRCFGATKRNSDIIFCTNTNRMKSVCTATGATSVVGKKLRCTLSESYLTSDDKNIFLSHQNDNCVICFDNNYAQQWKWSKPDVLKSPHGISIDSCSNVYVAGLESKNIVIISPDGQLYKEILTSKDGLERPRAVHFDIERNQLLVCNDWGPAFLYNVS